MGRFLHSVICIQSFVTVLWAIERSTLTSQNPHFDTQPDNITAVAGSTAKLPCEVWYRGDHKVVWMNPMNTVLTKLDHRIIDDMRISVERQFTKEWNLHIRDVKYEDRGAYTCTINTQPVQKKTVYLNIEVPPSINGHWSSHDITVKEGDTVELMCNASGVPTPTVSWFKYREPYNMEEKEGEFNVIIDTGEILVIHNISRFCDGVFECIAHNNVGQPVSRKMRVEVVFPPEVRLRSRRIGQFLGKETILECIISASPMTTSLWKRNDTELIKESGKFRTEGYDDGHHTFTLNLHIMNIQPRDYGNYSCYASNIYGQDTEVMVLYEYKKLPAWTPRISTTSKGMYAPIETISSPNIHDQKRLNVHDQKTLIKQKTFRISGVGSRSTGSTIRNTSICVIVTFAYTLQYFINYVMKLL